MKKIKLGTFNLFQFVEPPYSWYTKKEKFNNEQWLEKRQWIKNQILKMDCDVIGFQEVFSKDALKALVKEMGFDYFKVAEMARLNKITYVSTTVALASKYPIGSLKKVQKNSSDIKKYNLKKPFNFSRVPIKATILLPNREEILVYVAHLKSNRLNEFEYVFNKNHSLKYKKEVLSKALEFQKSEALKQRLSEASSLFFDIKKSKKRATILLCDLNDKEFSITIEALTNNRYHYTNKNTSLLYDASYQYKQKVDNPHPEAEEPKRKATSYFLGRGNVLDYIFISNHFIKNYKNKIAEVTDYRVLDKHLEEDRDGSLLKSDHAQVVCELTFINHIQRKKPNE
jgi:endonuclease/exonuclease/phosphatase family metal-dependent hydrolase